MNDSTPVRAGTPVKSDAWRLSLACWGALVAAILLIYRETALHLFMTWWGNETYQHSLLIPLILAYLVWIRRREVAALTPSPYLPAALLLLVGGGGWMVGELAGVSLLKHTALIGMLIVSVPLVFGIIVARGLLFPLFYALFLIPVGDQLIPSLQMITADITIFLLELFDVPAFIDGVFIAIPNGNFEVAEACSGVRFLIAMIAFSVLVAHLCFKSWTRRILFVASAIVLSIVANGIRAWGTIYIAWRTTPAFAAGVDHIVYGWIFFAIIMAVLLAAGWYFFDRPVEDPAFDPRQLQRRKPRGVPLGRRVLAASLGVAAIIAAPAYAAAIADRAADSDTEMIAMPDIPGWQRVANESSGWTPTYEGASAEGNATYVDAAGMPVDLYIAVYDRQTDESEMITFGNGVILPEGDWSWGRDYDNPPTGRSLQIQRVPLIRDVRLHYIVGNAVLGNDYAAKLESLKVRLLGGPTRAGVIVASTEHGDATAPRIEAVDRLIAAMGPLSAVLDQATIER